LDINNLDIDTMRDMEKFDDNIMIDDGFKNDIVKIFRIRKNILDTYEFWYYSLIQMYKHILGTDLFIFKRIKINNKHHNKYITNQDILIKYKIK